MATSKNPAFEWLRLDIQLIKSKRFHVFESVSDRDLSYEGNRYVSILKGSYADFLEEFGWAKLFTDHRDSPIVTVYPLKSYRSHICENGKTYIGFGDRGNQHVYFDEESILEDGQSRVYLVSRKKATELYVDFAEWILSSYNWAKSKYSPKQWRRIIDGPPPFSSDELSIVEARRLFQWSLIGYADDGDALFEIENLSSMVLPFLTIGITDVSQKILIGSVWLNVSHIEPGMKIVVKKDCYKDRIPPSQLEVFSYPDPIPEKKEAYWEFGQPS